MVFVFEIMNGNVLLPCATGSMLQLFAMENDALPKREDFCVLGL
jgi:hypothetical protein